METHQKEPSNMDLQNQIACNTSIITNEFYSLHRHIDQKCAHMRRKKTSHNLTRDQAGNLMLVQYYDNGTCEGFYLFNRSLGNFCVYKLHTEDYKCENELFLIYFPNTNIWIIGETSKLSEKYIYELFLQQEVPFNQSLPRAKVQRTLYEFFKGLIFSCENITTVPALAGWFAQRFRYRENIAKSPSLRELPIATKNFEVLPLKDSTFTLYKEFLQRFKDDNSRLMIALYPIISMLASIFKDFRGNINFALNLVPTSSLRSADVAEYFQIFSRDVLNIFSYEISRNNIKKILSTSKDEILLMDMRLSETRDYYRIKRRNEHFEFVSSVLFGRTCLPSQTGHAASAGLVTICDEVILKPDVYNIPTGSEFDALSIYNEHKVNLFKESKIMVRIFSQFIRFVERTGDDFFNIFTRNTFAQTHAGSILEITYNLFCHFWKTHNIDFTKELKFPNKIDFDNILLPETTLEDEDVAIFLDRIVENVGQYAIVPKRSFLAGGNAIFYDETFLYMPENLFKEICHSFGLKDFRRYMLKLRAQGKLSTGQDRLLKQVVVNHQTLSCYVFNRNLFRHEGQIDIVNLGKEEN